MCKTILQQLNFRYLCSILLSVCCTVATAETPEEYVKLAEDAFDKSDVINAMALYRKAAEAGYAPAQSRLGYLLDKSEENDEAFKWYQLAADQNDAQGQFGLAELYATGEGTKPDNKQALIWFYKSANQNYGPAIRVLAQAYEQGAIGLRVDYEKSQAWLQKGIKINDHWSIKRMIRAYKTGDLGLMINKQKAKTLEDRLSRLK